MRFIAMVLIAHSSPVNLATILGKSATARDTSLCHAVHARSFRLFNAAFFAL